jgi:hypothetical protein
MYLVKVDRGTVRRAVSTPRIIDGLTEPDVLLQSYLATEYPKIPERPIDVEILTTLLLLAAKPQKVVRSIGHSIDEKCEINSPGSACRAFAISATSRVPK